MAAIRYVVARSLRARWRGVLALVILTGLAGGVALFGVAGARRTASAYPRMLRATNAADVLVNPNNGVEANLDREAVAHVPGVLASGRIAGVLLAAHNQSGPVVNGLTVASEDRAMFDVSRPLHIEGRMPRAERADEIFIDRLAARAMHAHVGTVVPAYSGNADKVFAWQEAGGKGPPPFTPVRLRVTGIGVVASNVISDEGFTAPVLLLTPAYYRAHTGDAFYTGDFVRLRPGTSIPAFRRAVEALPHEGTIEFQTQAATTASVQRAIRPQAVALALFGIIVAATGLLVLIQAVARHLHADASDDQLLVSLGMRRRHVLTALAIRVTIIAVGGAVLAVLVAVALSPFSPIGPARLAEPHLGVHVDAATLAGGAALLVVLLVGISVPVAWRLVRRTEALETAAPRRPSPVVEALARLGARPCAVTGVRHALEPGRGNTAVPVRTTLVGAAVAVTAVVASLVFASSLHHLGDTPRLYGWNWDLRINSDGGDSFKAVNAQLAKDKDVAAFSGGENSRIAVGTRSIPAIGVDPRGGVEPTIAKGRAPTADGEIALGSRTLHDLGLKIGDHVPVTYGRRTRSLTVVGRAVFPSFGTYQGSDKTEVGIGALLTHDDLNRLAPSFEKTFHLVRLDPRADRAAAVRRMRSWAPPDADPSDFLQELARPSDIVNYRRVGQTPLVLAAVLALLAMATVAHALITSIRKRRRDIAVLRALGFGRGSVSATVAWQASTLVAVALVVGIPVGVAAGRWAWTILAQRLGAVVEPVTPALAVALLVPVALLVSNIVAAVPGILAGQIRPALALRTE